MSATTELRATIVERLATADAVLDTINARGSAAIRALAADRVAAVGNASEVDAATAKLVAYLSQATSYSRRVTELQRGIAGSMGDAAALDSAASALANEVTAASKALAPTEAQRLLHATDPARWSGEASDGYARALAARSARPSSIPPLSEEVERSLLALSATIDEYYRSLSRSVEASLGAILHLVAALATWEALPGGITNVISELTTTAAGLTALQHRTAASTAAIEQSLRSAVAAAHEAAENSRP